MADFVNSLFNSACSELFGSIDTFNSWLGDSNTFDWSGWSTRTALPTTYPYTTTVIINNKKLDKELVSSDYPPSDVFMDSEKNLVLELAVAGYNKEDIHIEQSEVDEDYLVVSIVPKKVEESLDSKKPKKAYLQKSISKRKAFVKYYIEPKKFDITKVSASLKDGILTIVIAKNDTAKSFKPVDIK